MVSIDVFLMYQQQTRSRHDTTTADRHEKGKGTLSTPTEKCINASMRILASVVFLLFWSDVTQSYLSPHFVSPLRSSSSLSMANFGDDEYKYKGFKAWAATYADTERDKFPEYFKLPDGVYELEMEKPLGIVFEETEADANKGVFVSELVEGGNAEREGKIQVGDILIACTGVEIRGAKFNRPLISAHNLDYDTIIGAISSNEPPRVRGPVMQFLQAGSPMPTSYLEGEMRKKASPFTEFN